MHGFVDKDKEPRNKAQKRTSARVDRKQADIAAEETTASQKKRAKVVSQTSKPKPARLDLSTPKPADVVREFEEKIKESEYDFAPPEDSSSSAQVVDLPGLRRGWSCLRHIEHSVNKKLVHLHSSATSKTSLISATNKRNIQDMPAYSNQDRMNYIDLFGSTPDDYLRFLKGRLAQLTQTEVHREDVKFFAKMDTFAQHMGSTFTSCAAFPYQDGAVKKINVIGVALGDSRSYIIRIPRKPGIPVQVIKLYNLNGNINNEAERILTTQRWEAENKAKSATPGFFGRLHPNGKTYYYMIHKDNKYTVNLARSLGDKCFKFIDRTSDIVEKTIVVSDDYDDLLATFTDGAFETKIASDKEDDALLLEWVTQYMIINPHFNVHIKVEREKFLEYIVALAGTRQSKDDITGMISVIEDAARMLMAWDGHGGHEYANAGCKWLTQKMVEDLKLTDKYSMLEVFSQSSQTDTPVVSADDLTPELDLSTVPDLVLAPPPPAAAAPPSLAALSGQMGLLAKRDKSPVLKPPPASVVDAASKDAFDRRLKRT